MTILVTGGSKCGKSSFAERILEGFPGRKIYIATMQPFGEDALEAIGRHRRMRAGKGFETVERYTDMGSAVLPEGCAVLLECMGNLCANEMFSGEGCADPAERIITGIRSLAERAAELVIVTNQVGSDGIAYPEGTADYIRVLGRINAGISAFADSVIECVYGIPLVLKGDMPC